MIIIFQGGLGNQMFQYSYYISQKNRYPNEYIVADLSAYDIWKFHNGYELNSIFGVNVEQCMESDKYFRSNINLLERVKRKAKLVANKKIKDELEGYDTKLIEKFDKKTRIEGYFQSYRYFDNVKKEIRREFKFPPLYDDLNTNLLSKILQSESIALHIRRGDYLNFTIYSDLISNNYYVNSIKKIKGSILNNRVWFVFSDDIEWCKKYLNDLLSEENVVYINGNSGEKSYVDMQLMSYCKYMIIANSTFSWWAAWLNQNGKRIIAPSTWLNNRVNYNKDICPKEWEII